MSGKGSAPRPYSVSQEEFANSFERIFGKKEKADSKKQSEVFQQDKKDIVGDSNATSDNSKQR
jgi:hypothetical protein